MPSEHLKKCYDHANAAKKLLGDHVKEVMADNEKYKQGQLIKLVLDATVEKKGVLMNKIRAYTLLGQPVGFVSNVIQTREQAYLKLKENFSIDYWSIVIEPMDWFEELSWANMHLHSEQWESKTKEEKIKFAQKYGFKNLLERLYRL